MAEIETKRLILRRFAIDDAPFFLSLLKDPDWIRFIGDHGVRSLNEARAYLVRTYIAQYEKNGFGFFLTLLKNGTPIGMCGLMKRESLDDIDIGFAFLPAYRGQGYAVEAARASLEYGRDVLKSKRVVAITLPENQSSIALIKKIGLRFERMIRLGDDPETLQLYAIALETGQPGNPANKP